MATAKTKSKTEKKTEKRPEKKAEKSSIDLSCLGEKGEKRAAAKRQVAPERVLAACLNYCATLSQRRHGIHSVLQTIELTTRCKI